jgi:hypothetical protein
MLHALLSTILTGCMSVLMGKCISLHATPKKMCGNEGLPLRAVS